MTRVLIVDDDPIVRHLMIQHLTGAGYFVLEAASPKEALQVANSYKDAIHLAIIDHTLADRSGLDVAMDIATIHRSVRILLISGYLEGDVLSELGGHGVKMAFLQKPFTRNILLAKVHEVLHGSNSKTMEM